MTRLKNPMVGLASYLIFYLVATLAAGNQWLPFPKGFWLSFGLLLITVTLLLIEQHQLISSQLQRLSWCSLAAILFGALLIAVLLYTIPRIILETKALTSYNSFQMPATAGWLLAGLSYNFIYVFASVIAVLVVPASFSDSAQDWQYLVPILICVISAPLDHVLWQLLIIVPLWLGLFLAYRFSRNFVLPLAIWLIFTALCDFLPITSITLGNGVLI